jgi:hypothetical protein
MSDAFTDEFLNSNQYYHSKDKHCRIQNIRSSYNRQVIGYMKCKCLTHKVIIGRSGWQLQYYGGTYSPGLYSREQMMKAKKEGKAYPV